MHALVYLFMEGLISTKTVIVILILSTIAATVILVAINVTEDKPKETKEEQCIGSMPIY